MGNVFSIQISGDAIFSRCLNCLCNRARYMVELEDNLDDMKSETQKLLEVKNDVMRRVNVAEQKQKKRTHQVQGWVSRVEDVEAEVGELLKVKSQQLDKLCIGGYCSRNCKSSYKFGKKVAKTLQVVATLMGEGDFEVVAETVEDNTSDEIPTEPTIVGLQSTFDQVCRFLGEDPVRIIGLYGTGGVGKTTLLKQIYNNLCNEPHDFDVVIWVVASKDPKLEMIQEVIGKKIGLHGELWTNRSLQDKARDIFNILNKKRFVLLLDDLWKRIDLTEIGVPIPSSKAASKMIFTTRFLEVCGKMNANKCLRVNCLSNEEAWKLFEQNLQRDILDSHPDIPQLARTVAKECCGLPLALVTISRAMSCKKTYEEWRYAVYMLRNLSYKFPGMGTEVYPLLKFSYDGLPCDKIRSCFLYCSLFPEDYKILKRELIDCWIGEDFLDEHDGSEVYNQGYDTIGVLVRACLLEEEGEYIVKMHDVIRDMVLWITCDNEKESFLVQAGVGLTEAPGVQNWEGVRRISLMQNKIENLSKTPACPDLQTLFLNDNKFWMFESDFFHSMASLKVLNLSNNTSLNELPSGISKLVSLQYLNLSKTEIEELPIEIKALVNLKCLILDHTWKLHTVPRQLIFNFSKLHVFRMFDCGFSGAKVDSVLFDGGESLVEELVGLKYLNVLTITLKTSLALQRLLSSVKLQSCTQSLFFDGFEDSREIDVLALENLKHLCILYLNNCDDLGELKIENVKPCAFHSLRTVQISFCSKLKELTWLVIVPNLKFLSVFHCRKIEEIISLGKLGEGGEMKANVNPFSKLQSLQLIDVPNLRSIYWKSLPFPHLKKISVVRCPKLKMLPLDSNSAKEQKIFITGKEEWWKELQWEDEATQNAFLPCFQSWG